MIPGTRADLGWWFVLVASHAAVFAGCWWTATADEPRWNYRLAAVEALSDRTEVLILGTSHVECAVNPNELSMPAMNLSGIGVNYVCLEGVFERHQRSLPGLRLLLIEADIFALRYESIEILTNADDRFLLDLKPSIRTMDIGLKRKLKLWLEAHTTYSPVIGPFVSNDKPKILDLILGHERSYELRETTDEVIPGFRPLADSMVRDGLAKIEVHAREGSRRHVAANIDALVRIIRRGLALPGVRVVLIRFPHHESYWRNRPVSMNEDFERTIERVRAEFGNAVPLWDFERMAGFDDADFFDGDHLNASGAAKFTPRLDSRVRAVLEGGVAGRVEETK